nr:NigD-like protein [uncultured Bacteroides sp.]
MKRVSYYLLLLVLVLVPTLQSCDLDDDDGYSLGNYTIALGTVKVDAGNVSFVLDNGEKLWPAATLVPYKNLENGTRIIGNFTLLSDAQNGFDHYVRLNDYSVILTKNVINLTEENKDSIGDDPARITDIWYGGGYINVEFDMNLPNTHKHRVNLVKNTTKQYPSDGYEYLEYRYNDMDDTTSYTGHSIVSFRVDDLWLINSVFKGWKIRINSAVNGEKVITIDYKDLQAGKSIAALPEKIKELIN